MRCHLILNKLCSEVKLKSVNAALIYGRHSVLMTVAMHRTTSPMTIVNCWLLQQLINGVAYINGLQLALCLQI